MFKVVASVNAKPFAADYRKMQVRRTTNRYGRKGTFSTNIGFMVVRRDPSTGRFASA